MAITSIWNNSFYEKPPIPKWSWELDFKSYFINTIDDMNAGSKMNYADNLAHAAVSCQWGGRQGNLISVYYAGVESKLPGRTQPCGDLTIKFNENTNMNITKILEELFHAEITCDSYFTNKEGYAFNKNFNKIDRVIRLLIHKPSVLMQIDPDSFTKESKGYNNNSLNKGQRLNPGKLKEDQNDILAIIEYHNCIMYKMDPNDLSYESEDDVITHSATFSYDYMTVGGGSSDLAININNTCEIHK